MGRFNEVLSGRFNALLRKYLPMEEQEGAPTLCPEITPTFPLWNGPEETLHLLGENLHAGLVNVAAGGAGTYGGVSLYNASSNIIAVVTGLISSAFCNYGVCFGACTGHAAILGGVTRDSRRRAGTNFVVSPLTYYRGSPVGSGVAIGTGSWLGFANNSVWRPVLVLVGPGCSMLVQATSANTAIDVSLEWREHRCEPGELV